MNKNTLREVFIYALINPSTREVRYIGKTLNPSQRISEHINNTKKYRTKVANWIKSISPNKPEMIIIDNTNEKHWEECEIFWISYFLYIGANLTNMTSGGDGLKSVTKEVREKISQANYNRSPESWEKLSKTLKGRKLSESHVKNISKALRIRVRTKETNQKISNANKGKSKSKESIQKQIETKKIKLKLRNIEIIEMIDNGSIYSKVGEYFNLTIETIRNIYKLKKSLQEQK